MLFKRYLRAGTHYYFRYEGSTTEPPCIEGVHWRVLKDPAKVAPSQISALQSLLVNRVDPDTCKPYTAARIGPDGSPHVNRPIQRRRPYHLLVYCECIDWESFTKSDRAYCKLPTNERGVVVRTEAPSQSPQPSVAPTSKVDVCECPTEKSSYLCNLFLLIRPTETPICPI